MPIARKQQPELELSLTPLKAALPEGRDAVVDILLRLEAPDLPAEAPIRPALDLALVIDRSGSMSGQPLQEAKRCAQLIVDALGPKDHVCVVAFGDVVDVVAARQPALNKEALRAAIASIDCDGMTALHGGWLKGAELIAEHVRAGAVSRVLLLSDGCANVGLTDPSEIAGQAEKLRAAGVSTSTYGLGLNFDERLMTELAAAGGGRAYYGRTAADLIGEFRSEFDLLSALCARDVTIKVAPAAGVLVEMLNDYPQEGAGWRLPDLAYDAEAWAVLRARIAAEHVGSVDGAVLLEARATAVDLDGNQIRIEPTQLSLPTRSPDAYAALEEEASVKRRVQEVEAARIQKRAREAAERGDWQAAEAALAEAKAAAGDNEFAAQSLEVLGRYVRARDQRSFSKESAYSGMQMNRRLSRKKEHILRSLAEEVADTPSYLRRKPEMGRDLEAQASDDEKELLEALKRVALEKKAEAGSDGSEAGKRKKAV